MPAQKPEIQFEKGTFLQYRVVGSAGLHLGAHELTLPENAEVEYDGTTLKYGDDSYMVPAVRGAVNAGWLVPIADSISNYVPKPAGVRVKAAQSHGKEREDVEVGTATEEERVVGDIDAQQAKRLKAAAEAMTTKPIVPPATVTKAEASVAEAGDGEVVAEVAKEKTLADKYPTVEDEGTEGKVVGQATKEGAEAADAPASQEGTPVGIKLPNPKQGPIDMSDMAQVNEAKAALQGESEHLGKPAPPERVKKDTSEDIREPGPGGATGDVTEATVGDDLTDLLPDAASTGKPEPTQTKPSADNFEWSTTGQWKARVKKAMAHADNPDVMRKIMSVETPAVRKHIEAHLEKKGIPLG